MTDASTNLSATLHPQAAEGEFTLVLRVTNDSDEAVDVLNPDLGRPSPDMHWPGSDATYRAALLMSFGYLDVRVSDSSGDPVEMTPIQTWATPALRPAVRLAPGESLDVLIPLNALFALQPGTAYRVAVGYGEAAEKVRAAATFTA